MPVANPDGIAVIETQSGNPLESRTIAIGDIHGCSSALNVLMEAIRPTEQDTVVILGDFIDRGPDSRGVIETLIQLQDRCRLIVLLGNHEEMLLAARQSRSDFVYWTKFGGQEMLDSYGPFSTWDDIPRSHWDLIRSCQSDFETEDFLFVHANYNPRVPLDRQSGTRLRWEHLDPTEAQPHYSGKTVIVGHTPQKSGLILDLGFVVCLDTGCHEGGWLTALDVTTGHVWQTNQEGTLRELDRAPRESPS